MFYTIDKGFFLVGNERSTDMKHSSTLDKINENISDKRQMNCSQTAGEQWVLAVASWGLEMHQVGVSAEVGLGGSSDVVRLCEIGVQNVGWEEVERGFVGGRGLRGGDERGVKLLRLRTAHHTIKSSPQISFD